jgi:hypothetical protein
MDLKHLPLPDLCHSHDWSPIAAAVGQSPLAAVLAGFAFSGATIVLTVPARDRIEASAAQALKLLFSSFFGLAVVSYLYADLDGEQACPRAEFEGAFNGGILGAFAVLMLVSLTWLAAAYRPNDSDVLRFLRGLIYVAVSFVVLLLGTSSVSFINADLTYGSHFGISLALFGVTLAAEAAGAGWVWRMERRAKGGQIPDPRQGTPSEKAVSRCVRTAVGCLAVSGVTAGVALGIPGREYYPPPVWWVYTAAWMSLLLPLAILALGVRAMARPVRLEQPEQGDKPDDLLTASS